MTTAADNFKLTDETKVTLEARLARFLPKRLQGRETVGELREKLTSRETIGAYRYSQGWQIEIRTTTNAGRMKRVACFEIA